MEEKAEKQKLIHKYKEAMSNKACRYFDEGQWELPVWRELFLQTCLPDGREERENRKWEHQADIWPRGTTSGGSSEPKPEPF